MISNELILLIAVPLAAGLLNIFIPLILRKFLTFSALLYTTILVIVVFSMRPEPFYILNAAVFSVDNLVLLSLGFIQLLAFLILLFSLNGMEKEAEGGFFIIYPLTVAFSNGAVLSENAISFMIFWGLSGLCLYLLGTLGRNPSSPKTAKKTFIITGGSDAFLLMGIVLIWFLSPSTGWSIKNPGIYLDSGWSYTAFIMLLIASFAKAGAFPFHTWVPDFCRDAQVESAAFFPASLDKLLGIFLLVKMVTGIFIIQPFMNMIIISLGALTIITAVMMAMLQHNGRKLLGYHAVSQVGYMVMGIGSGSVLAFAGGLFHMLNHTLYKSSLLLTLGSVEKKTGTNELDDLGGLGKQMPITFISALIGALAISGIPPLNGFFSKWMIYQGLLEKAASLDKGMQLWLLACIVTALFGSALTLASFIKFIHAVYLGRRPAKFDSLKEAPFNQLLSTGMLSFLCIVFGLAASAVPLAYLVFPVLTDTGFIIPVVPGFYDPALLTVLLLAGGLAALLVYFSVRKIRYDDIYIGGMPPLEEFRISGTDFYKEIRNFSWIKGIYNAAEKEFFDIYETGRQFTFACSRIFQSAHPGQMQLYSLFITVGLLLILLVLL